MTTETLFLLGRYKVFLEGQAYIYRKELVDK